jgi:hypothetical protein
MDELGHTSKQCEREGCTNEASRFYENGKDRRGNIDDFFICLDHEDVERAEEEGTIVNDNGDRVELAVYACHEGCTVCD